MLKKKPVFSAPKLYHGTTESIAKAACVKGLEPYEINLFDNGLPRRILGSNPSGLCLTTVYPGLMAFDTCSHKEKWGIIEIDISFLDPEFLMPYSGFLLERSKLDVTNEKMMFDKSQQINLDLSSHKRKWRESLHGCGICVYGQTIPAAAITKVTIYDPQTNLIVTKAILNTNIGYKYYHSNTHRQGMLTRWLVGENIRPEDWMGFDVYSKMSHPDKEKVAHILRNKNGLDIFRSVVSNGKKVTWW